MKSDFSGPDKDVGCLHRMLEGRKCLVYRTFSKFVEAFAVQIFIGRLFFGVLDLVVVLQSCGRILRLLIVV